MTKQRRIRIIAGTLAMVTEELATLPPERLELVLTAIGKTACERLLGMLTTRSGAKTSARFRPVSKRRVAPD